MPIAYTVANNGEIEAHTVPRDFDFDEEHTIQCMGKLAALTAARANARHASENARNKGLHDDSCKILTYLHRLETDPDSVIKEANDKLL